MRKKIYNHKEILYYLINVLSYTKEELQGFNTMQLLELVDDPDQMDAYFAGYLRKEDVIL